MGSLDSAFQRPREIHCTQASGRHLRERCCKVWGKGQNPEKNLFLALVRISPEMPESSWGKWFLSAPDMRGWDGSQKSWISSWSKPAFSSWGAFIHAPVWMKGTYQIVTKRLGSYRPSLTGMWGECLSVDECGRCIWSITQARSLKWALFFLFQKKNEPDL